jgi:hypothetical protein
MKESTSSIKKRTPNHHRAIVLSAAGSQRRVITIDMRHTVEGNQAVRRNHLKKFICFFVF